MALKEEEAARKKKLIGIRTKRCGGDTMPLGGNIRRPPLAVGPFMPRISTIQISILARWGCSATWGKYKRAALGSGFIHATKFQHSHLNPRGTHAPKNETEWWGYCGTWGKYKAAAFGSGCSHVTKFHHSHLSPRGTHAPQNETEWWGCSATWGKYKRAAIGSGFIHATKFQHSHLNPRGTHAPKVREKS
uniref:Uncharacterized protein n=1 Tax=Vespula pensylvanica TaxID=30213 RepID=A0A834MTB3_VESPE|nr:hypothetical protein H0235_018477 [Vespula pensylvanica]